MTKIRHRVTNTKETITRRGVKVVVVEVIANNATKVESTSPLSIVDPSAGISKGHLIKHCLLINSVSPGLVSSMFYSLTPQ